LRLRPSILAGPFEHGGETGGKAPDCRDGGMRGGAPGENAGRRRNRHRHEFAGFEVVGCALGLFEERGDGGGGGRAAGGGCDGGAERGDDFGEALLLAGLEGARRYDARQVALAVEAHDRRDGGGVADGAVVVEDAVEVSV